MRRLLALLLVSALWLPTLQALSLRERIARRRTLKTGASPEDVAVMRHFNKMASAIDIPGTKNEQRRGLFNSGKWMDLSELTGSDWVLINDRSWLLIEREFRRAKKEGDLNWRKVGLLDMASSMDSMLLGDYMDHFAPGHDHSSGCKIRLPRQVKFPTVRKIPPAAGFPTGILFYVTKTKARDEQNKQDARHAKAKAERDLFDREAERVARFDPPYAEGWKATAPTAPGSWVSVRQLRPGDVVRVAGKPRLLEDSGSGWVEPPKYGTWPPLILDHGRPTYKYGYLGPSTYGEVTLKKALSRNSPRPSFHGALMRGGNIGLDFPDFQSTFRLRRIPAPGVPGGRADFEMFRYPSGSAQLTQAKAARVKFLAQLEQEQRQYDRVVAPALRKHHADIKAKEENRIANCRTDWVSWFPNLDDCLADRNQYSIMYRPSRGPGPIARPQSSYQPRPSSSGGDPWARSRNNKIDYTIRQGRGESVGTYNSSVDY